jgi:hypothetical protein
MVYHTRPATHICDSFQENRCVSTSHERHLNVNLNFFGGAEMPFVTCELSRALITHFHATCKYEYNFSITNLVGLATEKTDWLR